MKNPLNKLTYIFVCVFTLLLFGCANNSSYKTYQPNSKAKETSIYASYNLLRIQDVYKVSIWVVNAATAPTFSLNGVEFKDVEVVNGGGYLASIKPVEGDHIFVVSTSNSDGVRVSKEYLFHFDSAEVREQKLLAQIQQERIAQIEFERQKVINTDANPVVKIEPVLQSDSSSSLGKRVARVC